MINAKTPEERSARMADHMKAMHDGMSTMKCMSGMSGAKGMSSDMVKHDQTMEQRMDRMRTMMTDRLMPSPAKQ